MAILTKNLFDLIDNAETGGVFALGSCGNSNALPAGVAWQNGDNSAGILEIDTATAQIQTLSFNYTVTNNNCSACLDGIELILINLNSGTAEDCSVLSLLLV